MGVNKDGEIDGYVRAVDMLNFKFSVPYCLAEAVLTDHLKKCQVFSTLFLSVKLINGHS